MAVPDPFFRLVAPGGTLDVEWPASQQIAYAGKKPRAVIAQGLGRPLPHYRATGQEGIKITVYHQIKNFTGDYNAVNAALLNIRDTVLFPASGGGADFQGTLHQPGSAGVFDPARPYMLVGIKNARIREPLPPWAALGYLEIELAESTLT